MIAAYKLLSKKFPKSAIDNYFKAIKKDSLISNDFSSDTMWFYLFDSAGESKKSLKIGYTYVNINITSPEFLSEAMRQARMLPRKTPTK